MWTYCMHQAARHGTLGQMEILGIFLQISSFWCAVVRLKHRVMELLASKAAGSCWLHNSFLLASNESLSRLSAAVHAPKCRRIMTGEDFTEDEVHRPRSFSFMWVPLGHLKLAWFCRVGPNQNDVCSCFVYEWISTLRRFGGSTLPDWKGLQWLGAADRYTTAYNFMKYAAPRLSAT